MMISDNLPLMAANQLRTLATLAENFKNFHARRLTPSLSLSARFQREEEKTSTPEKSVSSVCTKRIS